MLVVSLVLVRFNVPIFKTLNVRNSVNKFHPYDTHFILETFITSSFIYTTDLLPPRCSSKAVASGCCCVEGAIERIAHRARDGAHQQWATAAPDVAHAAPDVVHAAGRCIPRLRANQIQEEEAQV